MRYQGALVPSYWSRVVLPALDKDLGHLTVVDLAGPEDDIRGQDKTYVRAKGNEWKAFVYIVDSVLDSQSIHAGLGDLIGDGREVDILWHKLDGPESCRPVRCV